MKTPHPPRKESPGRPPSPASTSIKVVRSFWLRAMPPSWKAPKLLPGSARGKNAAAMARLPVAAQPSAAAYGDSGVSMNSPRFERLYDRGECPRRCIGQARDAAIVESVELTPGGRRKHTLQRTSPGGTTRTSTYISPTKAEVEADPDAYDLGLERYCRRGVAVEEVACQQSDAQRSAVARKKRKAKVLPAQQVKRACTAPGPARGDACDVGKLASALFG